MGNADITAQLVNNVFAHLTREGAIMSRTDSSHLLVEGNRFEDVTHPLFNDIRQPGTAFAPFPPVSEGATSLCTHVIGRGCVANEARASGDDYRPLDDAALKAFEPYRQYLITPLSAETTLAQVPTQAGAGKLHPDD